MRTLRMVTIFFILISIIQCSEDGITNIEFNPTDHPISKITEEIVLSIIVSDNIFYGFSADPSRLNCEGNACNDYLVKINEMNNLSVKLSDTNYFHWEFMTAVTPFPKSDCNLMIYGKNDEGDHLDYMCTIGRGEQTYKILLELSKSFSGEAHTAFVKIANYYKQS